jgi:hypothetical protein
MIFNDNRLLFVDDRHIESAENVSLTMNPAVKRGPCLRIETEWELRGSRPYSVVQWQGEYWLYYKTSDGAKQAMGLAVSKDGVNWTRPEIDRVPYAGAKHNNLVDIEGTTVNEICVFVDPTGPDEHRFKAVMHHTAMNGLYLMTSPDGLSFKRWPGMLLPLHVDNCNTTFWDERLGKYVVYARGCDKRFPKPPIIGCRSVVRAEADTLFETLPYDKDAPDPHPVSKQWTGFTEDQLRRVNRELPIVFECDELDDPAGEIYQMAAVHYLRDTYLAFPSFYYRFPWPPDWKYVNDGYLDLQFATSADGVVWRRDFRGPYVNLDLPDGPSTRMMHMMTGMAPHGYHISQYHMGSRRSHGEGRLSRDVSEPHDPPKMGDPFVMRVEQRLDGFVSADSAYNGGTLVTKPFVLESDTLRLNIDTSASGVAHAALLDENGAAIPGYGLEECDRIQGNDTQFVVSWNEASDLSKLKGRTVKLLIQSRSAKLYTIYP